MTIRAQRIGQKQHVIARRNLLPSYLMASCFLFALLCCSCHKEPKGYWTATNYWLRQNAMAVQLLQLTKNKPIVALMSDTRHATPNQLRAELRSYYLAHLKDLSLSAEDIDKSMIQDTWGTVINVDYSEQARRWNTVSSNVLNACEIVVWSSGPNRSNEYGGGDDMVWPFDKVHMHFETGE